MVVNRSVTEAMGLVNFRHAALPLDIVFHELCVLIATKSLEATLILPVVNLLPILQLYAQFLDDVLPFLARTEPAYQRSRPTTSSRPPRNFRDKPKSHR